MAWREQWIHMLVIAMIVNIIWTSPVMCELNDLRYAEAYLRKFYQMPMRARPRSPRDLNNLEINLKKMQNFFGLKETGKLTPETLMVMREPRCGVSDVENYSLYPGQPKWKNHTVTYKIAKYTTDLPQEEVERSMRVALTMWSDATDLNFIKVDNDKADIVITFASKVHGDFFPFDGPKGVLAHAFEPGEGMGGDVHFDDDEIWRMDHNKPGFNLVTVAAHELGHSLGLSHSKDPSSLMYPKYKRLSLRSPRLPKDDTLAIQKLYGRKKQNTPPIPKKCQSNFSLDAVTMLGNDILFFKDSYMWLRTGSYWSSVREGFIRSFLPNIPSSVDAAYHIPGTDITYIFTGLKYWKVQKLKMNSNGGPISDYGFPATVKKIDAAVYLTEFRKTYFFTGAVYYRYDEVRRVMDPGFPRKIQYDWPGVGNKIDAAIQFREGSVYFFSRSKAYEFNYKERRVTHTIKTNTWLGC